MDPTNLTPAGDQYSLGCVMYYRLTGRFPSPEGTAAEKMIAQQTKEPASLQQLVPDMPSGMVAVVQKLMDKNPANRFATSGSIVEALKPFTGSIVKHTGMPSGVRARPGAAAEPRALPARTNAPD